MVIKMKNNKNKTLKVLDLTLIIVGISTFIFTAIMIVFFALFQAIPDTLCERFYSVIVGELGVTGVIQVVKTIYKKNTNTYDTGNDCNIEINEEIEIELESEEDINE